MKIKFIKPLPRTDHIIPAGHILDAPEGFAKKMVQTGRAIFVGKDAPVEEAPAAPVEAAAVHEEAPVEEPVEETPVEAPKKRTHRKKA